MAFSGNSLHISKSVWNHLAFNFRKIIHIKFSPLGRGRTLLELPKKLSICNNKFTKYGLHFSKVRAIMSIRYNPLGEVL